MVEPEITTTAAQRRLILVTVGLALVMVVAAVSGLNVALPDLARDTGATQSQLQWIVDAYEIVFTGLLLTAGLLGDRYGRKRMLLFGLVVFGLAAGAAVVADDPTTLTWLRAFMGFGAAFVMPATLSTITTSFPADERGRAVGIWAGLAGAGAIIGIFASGLLLEWFSWSSFFALNAVVAVVAVGMTILFVPATRAEHPPRLDVPGAVLSLVGVSALVYGIIEGPVQGWGDPTIVAGLVVGGLALIGFVVWELRAREPMLDPRLFLLRGFGTGSLTITVQFMAFFGFVFLAMQYLQLVGGYSPLEAGFAMLPFAVVMMPLARVAPRIADRLGNNRIGAVGLTLMAIAMVVFTFLGVEGAVTGLPAAAATAAQGSLAGAQAVAAQAGQAGTNLAAAADQAFVDALGAAVVVAAVCLVVAAVFVLLRAPRKGDPAGPGA